MPRFFAPFDRDIWYCQPHCWSRGDAGLTRDLLDSHHMPRWPEEWTRPVDEDMEGVVVDTPWGDLIVVPCQHPESEAVRWDLPTSMWCRMHNRTVYYCDELKRLWCDGGPPNFDHHVFRLVAVGAAPE